MDPFALLPSPITEMILRFLPNLHSLHSFYNASPAIASLLHEDGVAAEIIESIFSRYEAGHGVPPPIQGIIRTVVLLHWRSDAVDAGITADAAINETPLPSDFHAFFGPITVPVLAQISPLSHHGDVPLPRSTPAPLLCRILALSTRIRHLAHRCMHELIARCMALKPSRLEDPNFCYRRTDSFEKFKERPPGKSYQPVDIGPPSWVEEQQVLWSLWWLVLFQDLRHGGALGLGWDTKVQKALQGRDFWRGLLCIGNCKNVEAVALWIRGTAMRASDEGRLPTCKISFSASEEEHIWCCKEYRPWKKTHKWMTGQPPFRGHGPASTFGTSTAAGMPYSPLNGVDFCVFQPYGFGIWDMERMTALGFLDWNPHRDMLVESKYFFTWESILSKEQLEKLVVEQKYRWRIGSLP